jgi:hypothetical protein
LPLPTRELLNTTGIGNDTFSGNSIALSATRTLRISGGTLHVRPAGALTFSGGKLDVNDRNFVTHNQAVGSWTGSAYTGVTGLIVSGRNGGGWNGAGIITSQSTAANSTYTTLGVATIAQVVGIGATQTTLWQGEVVTGGDTLVKYTYGGDANLDGKINVDDYGRIDSNAPLGTSGWYNGDFNYDGKINVDDYGIIDFNVGIQGSPFSAASAYGGVSSVPEPVAIGLLGGLLAGLPRRARRSQRG